MSENGNGKWQLAFWVITSLTVIIGGSVIANDRVRASEDQRVEYKLESCVKEQGKVNQEILVSLTEIKSDLKYVKQEMKKN